MGDVDVHSRGVVVRGDGHFGPVAADDGTGFESIDTVISRPARSRIAQAAALIIFLN